MNLALNARDAMPLGGQLIFETCNLEPGDASRQLHVDLPNCSWAMLTVSDTGQGMSEETLKHIFEPFFTTKELGKGTGLGLATVYGIVNQSGGKISVSSELRKGTSFSVYLPAAETTSTDAIVEAPVENVAGGDETILLVEDEPDLREITRVFLELFGYRVLETTDVEHALQIATTHADPIHLTLTDVIMPGMSGRQLAEQIVRTRPEMKVLYMTGYTDDMVIRHDVLAPGVTLLQKPFDKFQLAAKVRQVLDAG
jgi:CheY-like chemotaxis protein